MNKFLKIKKPSITTLDTKQQREIVDALQNWDPLYKDHVLEALDFIKVLMAELKSGKISINELKKILLNLDAETIKKLTQEY